MTIRTKSQLTTLFPNNDVGAIVPERDRDFIASAFGAVEDRDPTILDDKGNDGGAGFFDTGSRWTQVSSLRLWVCILGDAGAAYWQAVMYDGQLAGGRLDGTYPDPDLADTGVTPGTYGDGTHVGQFIVQSDGTLTFAQNVSITPPSSFPGAVTFTSTIDVQGNATFEAAVFLHLYVTWTPIAAPGGRGNGWGWWDLTGNGPYVNISGDDVNLALSVATDAPYLAYPIDKLKFFESTGLTVVREAGNQTADVKGLGFTICTSLADGKQGMVPKPVAGDQNKFLSAGGGFVEFSQDLSCFGDGEATVTGIQTFHVDASAPGDKDIFIFDSSVNFWYPKAVSGDGTISRSGTFTLAAAGPGAGTYGGDASHTMHVTLDARGRVTAVATDAIAIDGSAITSGTISSARMPSGGYGTGNVSTSQAGGLSATGTTQGTALALTHDNNEFTTVSPGTNDGGLLPNVAGARIVVWNHTANTLKIYPPSGQNFNGSATNAAFSVTAGLTFMFCQISTTVWEKVGLT